MTKHEFNQAFMRAQVRRGESHEFGDMFLGFALPEFQPVACTLDQLADLIRWQCHCMDGSIDQLELNNIWLARRKFIVVGVQELVQAA